MSRKTQSVTGNPEGWIRWPGLVTFVVLVGGLWLGGWLFADTLARVALERTLTRIQGAQVDIASADVSWQPFGLRVEGLAMTDPKQPERNAVELADAEARLDFLALLTGRVTIERLGISGLQLDTSRARPGRVLADNATPVPGGNGAEPSGGSSGSGSADSVTPDEPGVGERLAGTVELPDTSSALAAIQPLAVQTRAAEATETSEQVLENLSAARADVPDAAAVADYRERLAALQNRNIENLDDLQALRRDLAGLRSDLSGDREALNQRIRNYESGQNEITRAISSLANAPADDIERLRSRYNLSPDGRVELVELLLGPQWAGWLESGQVWYERAEPWLARLADRSAASSRPARAPVGRYVRFPEADPRPGFWLQQADIEWLSPMGSWQAELRDLSTDQSLIDRPTVLTANSDRLDQAESGSLRLQWDTRQSPDRLDTEFSLTDWRVRGWQLGGNDLSVALNSAVTRVGLDARYQQGWQGTLDWRFNEAGFQATSAGADLVSQLVNEAMEEVDAFEVQAELSGSGLVPATRWSSSLGEQVNSAVERALNQRYQAWENEALAELQARQEALAEPVRANRALLSDQLNTLEARRETLNNELAAQANAVEARLNEARRALENRARDEVEDRARESLDRFGF